MLSLYIVAEVVCTVYTHSNIFVVKHKGQFDLIFIFKETYVVGNCIHSSFISASFLAGSKFFYNSYTNVYTLDEREFLMVIDSVASHFWMEKIQIVKHFNIDDPLKFI